MIKERNNESGFTLIELMIVITIIGVLAAIAIPMFNAYRIKSYNSAALSDLRNMQTTQVALSSDDGNYGALGITSGTGAEVKVGTTKMSISINNTIGVSVAGSSFLIMSKHLKGDTAYGYDSDSSAIYIKDVEVDKTFETLITSVITTDEFVTAGWKVHGVTVVAPPTP